MRRRPPDEQYQRRKQQVAQILRTQSLLGRDVSHTIHPPKHPGRKRKATKNFRYFCDTYFPQVFTLPWSNDHLKVIAKIEQAVLKGGLFAVAMPRGAGKTTLAEIACLWAVLYGHRKFVCLIGSDESHAETMLGNIRAELESNDLLEQDFSEAVGPICALEGIANRCRGQLVNGHRTHIEWTSKRLVMPTVPGSRASGAILRVTGITGSLRGMKFRRPDGEVVRPDLVVIDDPQTDESARSPSQCAQREAILSGAILGLAGPGKKISGIMPLTVIRPGDLADNILNIEKHPEWNGERLKLIYQFPSNEALWKRYAEILADSLRAGRGIADATEFYRQNREAMDEGAVVAWPARYNVDELSAVQHAMNLRLRDEAAFWSEYQNEPLPAVEAQVIDLTPELIIARVNQCPRGRVPAGCIHLTGFIDCHENLLYWAIVGWESTFSGHLVDYGAFPDQGRRYFALVDAAPRLAEYLRTPTLEATLYEGLGRLCDRILGKAWPKQDGGELRVERCLIDANWGAMTDVVYRFCRQSTYANVLLPSHGRYVGASSLPFSEHRPQHGERMGLNWRIPPIRPDRAIRHIVYDTNFWKSFLRARLTASPGAAGALMLNGTEQKEHLLLADHLLAEQPIRTSARGRTVDEWKLRPGGGDNHWLDCLVGCCVGASTLGVELAGQGQVQRRKVSFAEQRLQKKLGR